MGSRFIFVVTCLLTLGFADAGLAESHEGGTSTRKRTETKDVRKSHPQGPKSSFSFNSYEGGIANLIEGDLKAAGLGDIIVDPKTISGPSLIAFFDSENYRTFEAKDKSGKKFTGKVIVSTYITSRQSSSKAFENRRAYGAAYNEAAVSDGAPLMEIRDESGKLIHSRSK